MLVWRRTLQTQELEWLRKMSTSPETEYYSDVAFLQTHRKRPKRLQESRWNRRQARNSWRGRADVPAHRRARILKALRSRAQAKSCEGSTTVRPTEMRNRAKRARSSPAVIQECRPASRLSRKGQPPSTPGLRHQKLTWDESAAQMRDYSDSSSPDAGCLQCGAYTFGVSCVNFVTRYCR